MKLNNPIRLSHSALDSLNSCERKFQLDRLLVGSTDREDSEHTIYGKAFGAGVASYLLDQNQDLAIYKCWLEYFPVLEKGMKSELGCIAALISMIPSLDNLLMDWEVMTYDSKPAIELSFRLDIDDEFYFVGYVDVVIRNRFTDRKAIFEVKTTSLSLIDVDPLYKNSGQALGYSIVLDRISGESHSEYDVIYCVSQVNSKTDFSYKNHIITYPKSMHDRLDWFITLGMDVNRLHSMLELNTFPRRGASCLHFMRACPHLGTCNLHGLDTYKDIPVDTIEYQFTYNLNDLITNHIKRIGE